MPLFRRNDPRFRVLYDAHAWAGVLAGLVLYTMFLTGIVALVWEPLEVWEEPHHAHTAGDVDTWWHALENAAPAGASSLYLSLPQPGHGRPSPIAYVEHPEGVYATWAWSPGGWVRSRAHATGFLFNVHFLYHRIVPQLQDIAGWLSIALIFVLVTGLAIHLRDLLPQLHRFRPDRPHNVVWSDAHKVTAVFGLPFQLLFAYSGAVLVLGGYAIGAVGVPLYGNQDAAREVAYGPGPPTRHDEVETTGFAPASAWIEAAASAIPDLRVTYLRADAPGRSPAGVRVGGGVPGQPGTFFTWIDGATADVVQVRGPDQETTAGWARRWIFALHFASVGGWGLKAMYASLALATAGTILTGNGIWLARRRRREERSGDLILARLTLGIGVGIPAAVAATMLAGLALPPGGPWRSTAVEVAFVATVAASCAGALVVRDEPRAWALGLAGGCAMFALLPLNQGLVSGSGTVGNWSNTTIVAVDTGFWLCSALLGLAAWWVASSHRSKTLRNAPNTSSRFADG